MGDRSPSERSESKGLAPDEERLLAAVVALETTRSFDGNEPAAQLGLAGQLVGIRRTPSDDRWTVPLVVDGGSPVELSDGPLLGRYWVGDDHRGEVVVTVRDGLLAEMRLVWAQGEPTGWPEPGDIVTS